MNSVMAVSEEDTSVPPLPESELHEFPLVPTTEQEPASTSTVDHVRVTEEPDETSQRFAVSEIFATGGVPSSLSLAEAQAGSVG